jgi:hypothetical protein
VVFDKGDRHELSTTGPGDRAERSALAARAPSVHNTQPWRWLAEDDSMRLFADWRRQVPNTDPDGQDLLVGCGAALRHLRVVVRRGRPGGCRVPVPEP